MSAPCTTLDRRGPFSTALPDVRNDRTGPNSAECPLALVALEDPMIPTPPPPTYTPGTRLRVTQKVRVGDKAWITRVEGVVELEGFRPVGGMEMGGKASYCHQPTIRLRRDDGEVTVVALDDDTEVVTVSAS
ncbi:MAG: hypothetical protein P4L84_35680 [Isosphaeraceae bacterium]|nr:hypothetical protein [Isosphaeraceae bacterium]